jgi:hypothetical protein
MGVESGFPGARSEDEIYADLERAVMPGEEPEFMVESAEGIQTFQGFTDEQQPEAAQWIKDRFAEMRERKEGQEPLPPAA